MKTIFKSLGCLFLATILSLSFFGCVQEPTNELASIEITSLPNKTTYVIGEELDTTGLEVKAKYTVDSPKIVTGWTVSGFDSSSATESQVVTVSYMEGGITKTVDFEIQIVSSLTKIEIVSQPTKKEYFIGQEFDPTGLSVKAYYDDGSSKIVTGWTTDFDSSEVATSKTVTVSYAGPGATKTATFTVDIIELKSISITKQPTKSEYYVGDKLDTDGMEVTASYTNGTTKTVTDYTIAVNDCTPNDEFDSIKYTVSHTAYGITKTATFSGKMKWHNTVEVLPSGTDGTLGVTGKYVLFGDFPQTIKSATVTIDESKTKTMGYLTYYFGSDGNWYARCTENAFSKYCNYSNGTQVANMLANSTKYFKVEPIKWRVLTDSYSGKSLLLAESILTATTYYESSIWHRNGSYPNNYKDSQIRAYLNGISYNAKDAANEDRWKDKGFLQTAFTSTAQAKIAVTTVDNSAASTTDAGNNLAQATSDACENTKDKIFLLSEKEATTTGNGFTAYDVYGAGNSRIRFPTDYALANYCNKTYSDSSCGSSYWLLRSPETGSDCARVVYYHGSANNGCSVNGSSSGVVPALSISL